MTIGDPYHIRNIYRREKHLLSAFRLRTLAISIALLIGVAAPLHAKDRVLKFAGHSFTIQLPKAYGLLAEANPDPSFKFFTFASAWRADHSLALIEITLRDTAAAQETFADFAEQVLQAAQASITGWQHADSTVQVNGVEARRTAWSGDSKPADGHPPDAAPTVMRGVLIVGIRDNIAFALHAYDSEPHASSSLPELEHALETFSLKPPRKR